MLLSMQSIRAHESEGERKIRLARKGLRPVHSFIVQPHTIYSNLHSGGECFSCAPRTHCGGNVLSCVVARLWQNMATLLLKMFLKFFRNIHCVRSKTSQHLGNMQRCCRNVSLFCGVIYIRINSSEVKWDASRIPSIVWTSLETVDEWLFNAGTSRKLGPTRYRKGVRRLFTDVKRKSLLRHCDRCACVDVFDKGDSTEREIVIEFS